MAHKFNIESKGKLDNDRRREVIPPRETLEELGLRAGDDVADVGCGIGYFTTEASKIAGSSAKVYGLDISEEMLEDTRQRAESEKLQNIITVKTGEYDLKLDDESVSYAFVANVVHEVDDKERFVDEMARILKPGGKLVVLDFEKMETEMGPPVDHRISGEEVERLLESSGLKIADKKSFSGIFYGIVSEKI